MRATFLDATVHHAAAVGSNYPDGGLRGRIRSRAQKMTTDALQRLSDDPAIKAWPD